MPELPDPPTPLTPQLSRTELRRYSRPLLLPEWGLGAQGRVRAARVLVVGAGGLGCAALASLAGAGVGSLHVSDGDTIDISNLHRQALYRTGDMGRPKAQVAAAQVQAINPHVRAQVCPPLTAENAAQLLGDVDVVLDATDNLPTRYALSAAAYAAGVPCVWGAASGVSGMMSVFANGAQLSDLFPQKGTGQSVADAGAESCDEAGVLGPVPQVVGQMMALETLKLLGGVGNVLHGQLWTFDALSGRVRILRYGPT